MYLDTAPYFNVTTSAYGYIPQTLSGVNLEFNNMTLNLTPADNYYNTTFSNYTVYENQIYTDSLTYRFNYSCYAGSKAEAYLNLSGTKGTDINLTCDNTINTYTGSYVHPTETNLTIDLYFNSSAYPANNGKKGTINVYYDLNAPEVTYFNFTYGGGFVTPETNISFTCTDNVQTKLNYTTVLNGAELGSTIQNNNTVNLTTTTNIINGINTVNVTCRDPLYSTTNSTAQNVEIRTLFIIDEQDNTAFDVQNVSSLIVYLDDNRTKYDFKANNISNISFIADANVKLRFEIIYADGTIILRYVDIGLLENDIRVCANTEGVTHYEQILTSYTTKPVVLNSVFADCVVAADYTRFAYQTSKVLKAYTYNNLYYLYTFEDDDITQNQVFLASVDGSIATYINLDALEFIEDGYTINTVGDTLEVEKRNENESEIYYYNVLQDNTALRITIERIENSGTTTLVNTTAFADFNEAQIIFNFETLSPAVNETTLFRVTSTATDEGGDESITIKYFNINGVTGFINSALIAIVSIFMLVFGLSFTVAQRTFAYFGIFIVLANIAMLTFATGIWYITFLQAINGIVLIFTMLVLVGKNQAQLG
jgi:hypothetical protein